MSISYATVTPGNMELTPMQVSFKGPSDSAFVDLGGTLGNVVVSYKYKKADIKADQLGETVLDRRISGLEVMVTTEFAEIKNKTLFRVLFPASNLVGNSPTDYVQFNSAIGSGDIENAGILKLHPLSVAPTDETFDYYFWKACSAEETEVTYGPTEQAKAKIVWNVLPDTSTVPARFFRYGDKDLA